MNERGGYHVLPSQFFCITVSKFFIGESSVFQKISGSGKICMGRDWDITFSRRIFSVSQFQNFTLGTPRCFTKLLAAKILYGCEWGYQVFPSNFSSLILPKTFIGNSSLFQKTSGSENNLWTRGRYHVFPVEIFLSHISKKCHWELFAFSKVFWLWKLSWMLGRVSPFTVENFLPHFTENFHWELFVVSE